MELIRENRVRVDPAGITRLFLHRARSWDKSFPYGGGGHASYGQGLLSLEPEFSPEKFKSETYIRLAIELQALGREKAELRLHEVARSGYTLGRAIILSRMLFKKRPGEQFARPLIGGAVFMGGTDYSDWPLEPIELVRSEEHTSELQSQ